MAEILEIYCMDIKVFLQKIVIFEWFTTNSFTEIKTECLFFPFFFHILWNQVNRLCEWFLNLLKVTKNDFLSEFLTI
jgi:hypothetical protein